MVDLSIDEDYRGLEQRRRSGVTAWVPVQRGCDHRCTFCIVPYVRGPEKNREPEDVLDEIRALVAAGVTEVTLLGQTVNSYRHERWDFPMLLTAVSRIRGIRRVRFTSPHPNDVTPALVEVMAAEDAVCEHIHLPCPVGQRPGAAADAAPPHGRGLRGDRGAAPQRSPGDRDLHRHHRRVPGRDGGGLRADAGAGPQGPVRRGPSPTATVRARGRRPRACRGSSSSPAMSRRSGWSG